MSERLEEAEAKTLSRKACAKAILVGEHFVVLGGTALAFPVRSARMTVKVKAWPRRRNRIMPGRRIDDERMLAAAHKAAKRLLTEQRFSIVLSASSNFPARAGLGASASFCVALSRSLMALAHRREEDMVAQVAHDLEKLFHRAPSGIDSTTVAFESPCYVKMGESFVNGEGVDGPLAGFLDVAPGAVFLLADSGERGDTVRAQAKVAQLAERTHGDRVLSKLTGVAETIALQSASALRAGDYEYVGTMMTETHYLLQAIGVSTDRLDRLCRTAVEAGALGAKLTGSGLGGFILAALYPDDVPRVKEALQKEGVKLFFEQPTEGL